MSNDEANPYVSVSNANLAYDCARAWSMVYKQLLRPKDAGKQHVFRGRALRVGSLGHLHLQHALAGDGIEWDRRLAAHLTGEDLPYFADEDRDAKVAADRVLADLSARRRVVVRDAEGPMVEREVVASWRALQRWLGCSVPNEVFLAYPRGIGGRIDLVDMAPTGDDPDTTIRDYKFTQKAVAADDGVTCPTPDRQACWYVAILGALGLPVSRVVQTVVFAGPMLTVDDFLHPYANCHLVRADGLPSRVPRNVEAETYREAWNILRLRRISENHVAKSTATLSEYAEMEAHIVDLANIRRVVERPLVVSQAVAREVVLDALHTIAGRLRDHDRGVAPANLRAHESSPCRRWCDAKAPCHASLGLGRGHAGFAAVADDMAQTGELETREVRRERRAAALKILAGEGTDLP